LTALTIIPTIPIRKPIGHTMIARLKNTGSSKFIKPLTALCRIPKTCNPTKEASINSKKLFKLCSNFVLAVRTNNVTPSPVRITPPEETKI
jgi:hypothetical protein